MTVKALYKSVQTYCLFVCLFVHTCSCASDFVMPMEPEPDFQMVTFLEPHFEDWPSLPGFPNLNPGNSESPQGDSDIPDSCPTSPSPLSSPSPHSSASSSESGFDDEEEEEEANGPLVVKMETMETRASLASALMDHSQSPIFQSPAQIRGLGDKVKSGVQTVASPTPVSHSYPQSVQVSQTTPLLPTSRDSVSSQLTKTLAIPKLSMPPPASPSRIKNKNTRNLRKTEPKIVIIEEPEEVFALNISENLPDYSLLIVSY